MKPLSAPAEDCLLLIHRLEERGEIPSTSGLARGLKVTDSTITAMLQKLSQRQLIYYQPRKDMSLTPSGRQLALQLIRRHRLIETFLMAHLGYRWDEVHAEAERIEHVVSERFVDAVNQMLGFPTVDPHGDPIPDAAGVEIERHLRCLADLAQGERGVLARVMEATPEALIYLGQLGLTLGVVVEVVAVPAHDSVMELMVNGRSCVLGRPLAAQILVENVN